MLLLRAPTTRPNDVAISLRARSGCRMTADEMARIAVLAKCPPTVADRVRTCILHSGRYDCRVSAAAAFLLARSPREFARCGGTVILVDIGI